MSWKRKWIWTKVVSRDGEIIESESEGFWYEGPLAEAVTMAAFDQEEYAFYSDGTESGSTIIGTP